MIPDPDRPRLRDLLALIREDWHAHGCDWTKPGFRTLAVHRFGAWRAQLRLKPLRAPLTLLYRSLFRRCRNLYGIELPYSVRVGRGVVIEHQGGIVIHGDSVIGNRCIIRQGCTLGLRRLDDLGAAPTLEDDVHLGAGAVLLGRIRIGRGAVIGANAVVLADVPSGAVATGVPARIQPRPDPLAGAVQDLGVAAPGLPSSFEAGAKPG